MRRRAVCIMLRVSAKRTDNFTGRSARPRRHDDKQDTGFGCDLADEGEDQRVFGLSNEQKRL
jgi:hypothetical protein